MKKRRFFAGFAAAAIAASMMALPASADANHFAYALVNGNSVSFRKYLVMDSQANVPNATFNYTISAGTAKAAETTAEFEVFAGVGTPTISNAAFTVNQTTYDTAQSSGKTAAGTAPAKGLATDTVNLETGEKYAKSDVTVDFTGVSFPEPGVYRYVVTETSTAQGVTIEGSATKTLDVYVEDNGSGTLSVNNYVLYDSVITTNTGDSDTGLSDVATGKKVDGYQNYYDTSDLLFGKEVTGNQGSKDKYFKYTVVIDNVVTNGTVFDVDISKADATVSSNTATEAGYIGKSNPNQLVVDTTKTIETDGYKVEENQNATDPSKIDSYKITAEYYLHDGQYINIKGLVNGNSYSVTEDNEDYSKTDGIVEALSTINYDATAGNDALTDTTSGNIVSADIHTGYTNNKTGTIPTGVILSVAAPAVVGLGVLGLIVTLNVKKKREEAEE